MTFEEKVVELDKLLNILEDVSAIIKEKKEAFDEAMKPYIKSKNELVDSITSIKKELSDMCVESFNKDGTKKFYGGLAIRETKKQVYSEDDAMEWATKTGMCLALDKKKFESIAKTGEIDFVTTETIPSTTFPKEIKL